MIIPLVIYRDSFGGKFGDGLTARGSAAARNTRGTPDFAANDLRKTIIITALTSIFPSQPRFAWPCCTHTHTYIRLSPIYFFSSDFFPSRVIVYRQHACTIFATLSGPTRIIESLVRFLGPINISVDCLACGVSASVHQISLGRDVFPGNDPPSLPPRVYSSFPSFPAHAIHP